MAATKTNEKVMEYVTKALSQNPDMDTESLKEGAEKLDPSIKNLNKLQFHARYPLQVKRRMGATAKDTNGGQPTAKKRGRPSKAEVEARAAKATPEEPKPERGLLVDVGAESTTISADGDGHRDLVRGVLFRFMREVSISDVITRDEMITIFDRVDSYVEEIVGAIES